MNWLEVFEERPAEEGTLSIMRHGERYQVRYASNSPQGREWFPRMCGDEEPMATLLHACGVESAVCDHGVCSAWRLLRPLLFCWPPRYFVIEMGSRGQRRLLVSDVLDPAPLPEGLGIPAEDWYRTPVSVRLVVLTLLKRLETLEARLQQNSANSSRPPFTDTPSTKRQRRIPAAERRKPGGKRGHLGHPQVLLDPTTTIALLPELDFVHLSQFASKLIGSETYALFRLKGWPCSPCRSPSPVSLASLPPSFPDRCGNM